MPVLPILKMGDPLLREKARELTYAEITSPQTHQLVLDMIETMRAAGGIGLAAPQVGVGLRLAIIEITGTNPRYPDQKETNLEVFFNPEITILESQTRGFWEGCLSVPGLRGYVERPQRLELKYINLDGERKEAVVEGFLATVFQHEFDHLDGVLYVDHVKDSKQLVFNEEYEKHILPGLKEGTEV